jgi:branched-chain amino acid transport system substrate-binding protein
MKKTLMIMLFSLLIYSLATPCYAEIKVGGIFSLSGSIAFMGGRLKDGAQLAIEKINAAGGIKGEKIVLVIEDSKSEYKDAVNAVSKLAAVDKVKFFIGPEASSAALAMTPVIEKERAILICPVSTHPDVPNAQKGVFRVVPSDSAQGVVGANLARKLGLKKVGVLYLNSDYGKTLAEIFSAQAKNYGIEIPVTEKFNQGDTDFRSQVTKVKAANIDGIYMTASSVEAANIAKQAHQLKLNVPMVTTDGALDPKTIELGGKDIEGLYATGSAFDPKSKEPSIKAFVDEYKTKYKEEPGIFAALAYDAMSVLAEAMKLKGIEPDQVREGLVSIKEFPGVTGRITFKPNGDVDKEIGIFKVISGEFIIQK